MAVYWLPKSRRSDACLGLLCRRDPEGLPVYDPDELGIGKGGDTAACPFDCECCL